MSDPGKAVFLSYASQDADAAKRIADALRAAGVEVWFDAEGGLEHGDEWDAKIRRQIKECVLFIPIVSAHTEEREEGYFRIEWELAAQRALGIASGVAFILPVVIDGTKEQEALVPDRFRSVQWTKLPGGVVPAEVLQRFLKLWSHRTGAIKHGKEHGVGSRELDLPVGASLDDARGRQATPLQDRYRWFVIATVIALLVSAAIGWRYFQRDRAASLAGPPAPPAGPRTEAQELVARMWGIYDKIDDTSNEEWELAEELGARATMLEPLSAEAWAVYANVISMPYVFGIDPSPERVARATKCAERAVSIAPESVQARLALANVRRLGGSTMLGEAISIIRALLASEPSNRRVLRMAGNVFRTAGQYDEAVRHLERAAALPGGDRVALFGISRIYLLTGRLAEAEAVADRAGVLTPGPGGQMRKLFFQLYVHDDLAAAEKTLAELPGGFLLREEGADYASTLWLWRREPDKCASVLNRLPRDTVRGVPNGLIIGWAYRGAGREAAAALQWQETLQRLDARLAAAPSDTNAIYWKISTLASLGRRAQAEALLATYEQLRPADTPARKTSRARVLLQIGRTDEACDLIEQSLAESTESLGSLMFGGDLRHDPMFDTVRAHPRFKGLLARMDAALPVRRDAAAVPPVDDKSVAVLAFANLSDEKANEYFSDGISEELLNVLAKVPGLKVTARTSAFHFKGKDTPIPEIARQLGVAYVVEGSVRKSGDKVRITAQLIKAADGFHVWSDTFTRDLKDIFAVQDEIAALIAKNLELKLGQAVEVTVAAAFNPEAFRLYLQGREAWNRRDAAGFQQAELLFHRALELEPRFARAHAALADVWMLGATEPVGGYAQRQSPLLMRIIAKAEQAVAMDGKSAEAHASLGHVLGYAWRFANSQRALQRAIELNPNYASANQWLGRALLEQGLLDEALVTLHRAAELDPLSHRILDNYADALECAGRLEEAWAMLGRAAALQPLGVQIRCKQALLLQRLGRREEALAAARALAADTAADDPDYRHSTAVAVLSACGETAEAEASLRRIAQDSEDYPIALLNIGRTREFIAHLDYASINWIHNFWFHPEFAAVRAEPALRAWTEKVGLAEALARAESWTATHRGGKPAVKQ